MKKLAWLILATLLFLSACQSAKVPVTIMDGEQTYSLNTAERVPSKLLSDAGVTLAPA